MTDDLAKRGETGHLTVGDFQQIEPCSSLCYGDTEVKSLYICPMTTWESAYCVVYELINHDGKLSYSHDPYLEQYDDLETYVMALNNAIRDFNGEHVDDNEPMLQH
jgi:hypothetical protein